MVHCDLAWGSYCDLDAVEDARRADEKHHKAVLAAANMDFATQSAMPRGCTPTASRPM